MPGTDMVDIAVGEEPNFGKGTCYTNFRMAAGAGTGLGRQMDFCAVRIQQTLELHAPVFERRLHWLDETEKVLVELKMVFVGTPLLCSSGNGNEALETLRRQNLSINIARGTTDPWVDTITGGTL